MGLDIIWGTRICLLDILISPMSLLHLHKNKTNTQMQSLQGYFPQCSAVLLWTFLTCTLGVCASSVHKEAAEFKIWNVCFCFYGVITYIGIWLLFFVCFFINESTVKSKMMHINIHNHNIQGPFHSILFIYFYRIPHNWPVLTNAQKIMCYVT